jgi:predicted TIM-barrel fold metal-dependent hydrolase
MLIDCHVQFAEDLDSDQLVAARDACGLQRMLLANRAAASPAAGGAGAEEARANQQCLLRCRRIHGLSALYWTRVGAPDSHVEAFHGALHTEPFAAALFAPHANGFELTGDDLLPAYFAALAKLRVPALVCVRDADGARPRDVLAAARAFPDVSFLICGAGQLPGWNAFANELALLLRDGNVRVFLDTAGLEPSDLAWAVELLGPARFLYSSGAQLPLADHGAAVRANLEGLRAALPTEAFRLIAGENAIRLFGFGTQPGL